MYVSSCSFWFEFFFANNVEASVMYLTNPINRALQKNFEDLDVLVCALVLLLFSVLFDSYSLKVILKDCLELILVIR